MKELMRDKLQIQKQKKGFQIIVPKIYQSKRESKNTINNKDSNYNNDYKTKGND